MEDILEKAIQAVQRSESAFCKFISANDAGKTGAHQSGYYIGKSFLPKVFEQDIMKDRDYLTFASIKWQDDFITDSRFKYYGSKNECHLTRFGKNFPFLSVEVVGDLLVICKVSTDYYEAFVIQGDENIENFLAELNISPTDTDGLIPKQFQLTAEEQLNRCFAEFLKSLKVDFPLTLDLATNARKCYNSSHKIDDRQIKKNPDKQLLNWLEAEFQLFKVIEKDRYLKRIETPFKSVEELVDVANSILNRRKSRAGKSLEHHLTEVFKTFQLDFDTQATTEDKKKPDFIFPNTKSYLNPKFDQKKLVVLASKTTCKDRWRQVLNEADRIKTKHLFTLQQGISKNQLEEMYKYGVCLVVPKRYLKNFPEKFRDKILTLDNFIGHVQKIQSG